MAAELNVQGAVLWAITDTFIELGLARKLAEVATHASLSDEPAFLKLARLQYTDAASQAARYAFA